MPFLCSIKIRRLLALLIRAKKCSEKENYLKALRLYNKALKLIRHSNQRVNANIHERIGEIYKEFGLYEEALKYFVIACKFLPNSEDLQFKIGTVYSLLDERSLANHHFHQAYWLVANDIDQLRSGARWFSKNGFSDLAMKWYERAIRISSSPF